MVASDTAYSGAGLASPCGVVARLDRVQEPRKRRLEASADRCVGAPEGMRGDFLLRPVVAGETLSLIGEQSAFRQGWRPLPKLAVGQKRQGIQRQAGEHKRAEQRQARLRAGAKLGPQPDADRGHD